MVRRTGFRIQDSGFRVQGSRVRIQESGVRIRSSSFALALLCIFFCSSLVTRHSSLPFAQQPQAQQGQPLYTVNAKYVNGVAPGYWPTNGTGLTLNLSAGTSVCGNSPVPYAGGTLSMTASATNYVFLDTTNNCTPALTSSGSSFPATGVPIAVVTTSASAITAISDVRSWFAARPVVDPGGQVYNVKSFGAAGDGVTDDTVAIQAGLNQVCGTPGVSFGTGNLFFPLGTYKITSTLYCYADISHPSRISGAVGGGANTIGATIAWYGASGGTMMVLMGWRNSVMENISFACRGVAQYGIVATATNVINTTLGTAVTTPGSVTVTPGSMGNIAVGTILNVDTGSNFEVVFVSAVGSGTFTATFAKTHLATAVIGNSGDTGIDLFQNVGVYDATGSGWLVGNYTGSASVDVAGIHWDHCYVADANVSAGTTYAGVQFEGRGNVQQFSWTKGWFGGLQHGFDFTGGDGYLDIQDTNFEGDTVSDILASSFMGVHIRVSGGRSEAATGGTFVSGPNGSSVPGSLEVSNFDAFVSPTSDYVINWSGSEVLSNNIFANSHTSSSIPKIIAGFYIHSVSNYFVGVCATGWPECWAPYYDTSGNPLLPTYTTFNSPVPVFSFNDQATTTTWSGLIPLRDYMAAGVITDYSQYPIGAPIASTGVLRGGDTSILLGWKSHTSGNPDITVSKDTSDVIRIGGAFGLGTGTAINAMNLYSTASISPTAVTASSCSDQTFTVSGLLATDRVSSIAPPSALGNLSLDGYASAANTVLLHFCNPSASSVTPPAGVYSFLAVH